MKKTTRRTTRQQELKREVEDLRSRIAALERGEKLLSAEYTRYHDALEGLLKDIFDELSIDYVSRTSIASARLIAAVAKASERIHRRQELQ